MGRRLSIFLSVFFAFAALCAWTGCGSYAENSSKMRNAWRTGNFTLAEAIAASEAVSADADNLLLWQLEHASVLRGQQKNAEAQQVLEAAAKTLEMWDEQPEILLSQEIEATFSNLSALPYRGRGIDRIMLQTYRALNFLEAGEKDAARVALNAAFQAQSDAVEQNEEKIREFQDTAEALGSEFSEMKKNDSVNEFIASEESRLSKFAGYADYVNPFTTWLHGIYFLHAGEDGSDRERARKSLERVVAMEPGNTFVREDLETAKDNDADDAITYVIFEYGLAPTLNMIRADLLLTIPTGRYPVLAPMSIALPRLSQLNTDGLPVMRANDVPAQTVCNMDRVIQTDFRNSYPRVLARTLLNAFLKTTASVVVNAAAMEYANSDGSAASVLVALGTMIGTSAATYASTDADVRTWQTLPANFSVARLPTPASRNLVVDVAGHRSEVKLLPGKVNVVFVKSVGFALEPKVNQFILKK